MLAEFRPLPLRQRRHWRNCLIGVLMGAGQVLLYRAIQWIQAVIFPGRAITQEHHPAAIDQRNRLFAAAPGMFKFGQVYLDDHHAQRTICPR